MGKINLKFNLNDVSLYKNELYGVSILWIMLFHAIDMCGLSYSNRFSFLAPINNIISYGNMGTDVFLFCAGIFLYFSYIKNKDLLPFLKRKVMRLFLPVLIIDGWYWFLLYFINGKPSQFLGKILLLDFWTTGSQQIWFVSFLLVCYISYPYVFAILFGRENNRWSQTISHYMILMCVIVIFTLTLRSAYPDIYLNFEIAITRIPIFITGCLFGKLVCEKREWPGWIYLILIALTVLTFVVLNFNILHDVWKRWWYILGGLSLTFLIPLVLRVLRCKPLNRFLGFLGKISLNLYLTHNILIHVSRQVSFLNINRLYQYLLLLLVSILVAWLAEFPIRKLYEKFCINTSEHHHSVINNSN